jgi:DNA-binding MarR family transcriptional regulator
VPSAANAVAVKANDRSARERDGKTVSLIEAESAPGAGVSFALRRSSQLAGFACRGHVYTLTVARNAPSRPAHNILGLVQVLSNLLGPAFYGQVEQKHEVTIAQWRIMLTLANHPGATAVDITAQWALQPMAVSRAIRELEQRRLLVRRPKPADGRSHALSLTARGHAMYEAVAPDATARYREIVDCLSRADRAELARMLTELIEQVRQLPP